MNLVKKRLVGSALGWQHELNYEVLASLTTPVTDPKLYSWVL